MWMWMVIALNVVTNVHGYASYPFPEACESMLPQHEWRGALVEPKIGEPPFEIHYELGKEEEPIRGTELESSLSSEVTLRSKMSATFQGFMLEARKQGHADDGPPVGRFILLDEENTQLLDCAGSPGSAVIQSSNHDKVEIKADWTADGAKLNITFRTTFLQDFRTFWKPVDKNVTETPPTPTTTTSTSEPSSTSAPPTPTTTTSTSEPSSTSAPPTPTTTTSTSEPSSTPPTPTTTTSTSEPSSTSAPPTPTTTTSTSEPSSTSAPPTPTTTTSTSEPSSTPAPPTPTTTTSTSEPSSTLALPTSSTANPVTDLQPSKDMMAAAMTTMTFDSLGVVLGMELCNIFITITSLHHGLNKGIKITCIVFCAAVEISALVLCCVGDFNKAVLIPLVATTMVINFIQLIIESLPLASKLQSEADVAAKVCSVIHELFTIAVMFVAVWETDHCRKNQNESWLITVMAVYTAWMFLFMIWVFVLHQTKVWRKVHLTVNPEKNFPRKKKLCTADKAFSVILIVGTVAFNVAIIYGIFG